MMAKQNPTPRKTYLQVKDFQYPIASTILLAKPTKIKEVAFFKTVLSRRSANSFEGISESKLSLLLHYSMKAIEIGFLDSGYMWSKRPSPSAGGIHPIDLIICGPSRGPVLYYYNPVEHSLSELKLNQNQTIKFIEHVHATKSSSENATILWMVAHQYRMDMKYKNADSLVWRDAGCLLYCLNLVSTALGIQCCSLGSLGEPHISRLFKNFGIVYGVGGCAIG